jgi:hypothetical protein
LWREVGKGGGFKVGLLGRRGLGGGRGWMMVRGEGRWEQGPLLRCHFCHLSAASPPVGPQLVLSERRTHHRLHQLSCPVLPCLVRCQWAAWAGGFVVGRRGRLIWEKQGICLPPSRIGSPFPHQKPPQTLVPKKGEVGIRTWFGHGLVIQRGWAPYSHTQISLGASRDSRPYPKAPV